MHPPRGLRLVEIGKAPVDDVVSPPAAGVRIAGPNALAIVGAVVDRIGVAGQWQVLRGVKRIDEVILLEKIGLFEVGPDIDHERIPLIRAIAADRPAGDNVTGARRAIDDALARRPRGLARRPNGPATTGGGC